MKTEVTERRGWGKGEPGVPPILHNDIQKNSKVKRKTRYPL
jgi:hypothetical protein